MKKLIFILLVLSLSLLACQQKTEVPQAKAEAAQRPNILWIVSEDNSPWLGSYGDQVATTPRLDALAGEGIRKRCSSAAVRVVDSSRLTGIQRRSKPSRNGYRILATVSR